MEETRGGEDAGVSEEGGYGGEPAMNDRNQRNTAPRKLPGIHPEYIIHTGVPARRPPRWVKGSRTPERTRPRGERSVPVKSRTTLGRAGASRAATSRAQVAVAFTGDHPELFLQYVSSPFNYVKCDCSDRFMH